MKVDESQDGIIINGCKHLGDHVGFYVNEVPALHFECECLYVRRGDTCQFPDGISNPKSCVYHTSGGEVKVIIRKEELLAYYNENLEVETQGVKKFIKGKPDILVEGLS